MIKFYVFAPRIRLWNLEISYFFWGFIRTTFIHSPQAISLIFGFFLWFWQWDHYYYKQSMPFYDTETVDKLTIIDSNIESLFLKVKYRNSHLLVASIYRPLWKSLCIYRQDNIFAFILYNKNFKTSDIYIRRFQYRVKSPKPTMNLKPTLTNVRVSFVNALHINYALSILDKKLKSFDKKNRSYTYFSVLFCM